MTDLVALYFSPRKGGNSDLLMDAFLKGAGESGAKVERIYARDLEFQGCIECAGCDDDGVCILEDDLDDIYPVLIEAKRVVVASPIFFYGLPSQGKAFVDRSQALWNRVRLFPNLVKKDGRGFFLAVGATKGKNLFDGTVLCVKYFMNALGLPLDIGTLMYRKVEAKGAIKKHENALAEAYEAGKAFIQS